MEENLYSFNVSKQLGIVISKCINIISSQVEVKKFSVFILRK